MCRANRLPLRVLHGWIAGPADPNRFGHGQTTGLWFLKVNLIRDHYAINNQEVSAWDDWRAAPEPVRAVDNGEFSLLDTLAMFPEHRIRGTHPRLAGQLIGMPEPDDREQAR